MKKIVAALIGLVLSLLLLGVGFRVARYHNNQLDATTAYAINYQNNDTKHNCLNIAEAKPIKYSASDKAYCEKSLKVSYGWPFHWQTIDYQGKQHQTKAIYYLDFGLVMLGYVVIVPVVYLLSRYVVKRKNENIRKNENSRD